jgi:hypothetical protein
MCKLIKIYILGLILILLLPGRGNSQTVSSPYSIFGLGLVEGKSIGPGKGMGGTGIAFQSGRYLNLQNPASYSGIDSLVSIFETGFFGKYTVFSGEKKNQSSLEANFKYIAMGFRITPWLTTSFGFTPYSTIGYNIKTLSDVEGTSLKYNKRFTGEGGANQVYLGGSVQLIKNLSAGVNLAYIFGTVTQIESAVDYYYVLKDITYLSNIHLDYGLNYGFSIKNWRYGVGLIYGGSKKLTTDNVTTITTNLETEELKSHHRKFSIPQNYGIGFSAEKNYFTVGVDYERSVWKDIEFENLYLKTRNSQRFSVGVEFPSLGINKGTGRMIMYRVGAQYQQSYLVIKKIPIDYYAITIGAGLPLKGAISTINLSLEVGQNGTTKKDLFRENFITLHIDLSLRDIWFMKRRYL